MRCPTLKDLPLPPSGKTGWPWTVECPQLPETMLDGKAWPMISIVTPSYNQAKFLEETIRSVLLQGYPNVEYIIMDGGSTDNSVEVIKKYSYWLKHWVSESDGGQSHAINSGFKFATGNLLNWLNSDDTLCENALFIIGKAFDEVPDASLFTGARFIKTENSQNVGVQMSWMNRAYDYSQCIPDFPQESTFFTFESYQAISGLDVSLEYNLDVDFYYRILKKSNCVCCLSYPIGALRIQSDMKTLRTSERKKSEYETTERQIRSSNFFYLLCKRFYIEKLFIKLKIIPIKINVIVYRFGGWQQKYIVHSAIN